MFMEPFVSASRLAYCLTCGGTGVRGGKLSGKKKCKTCNGSGWRAMVEPQNDDTLEFARVTIPAAFYPRLTAKDLTSTQQMTKENDNGIYDRREE
jgi:hypothetical protein